MAVIYSHEKVIIIRVRTDVHDNGSMTQLVGLDSDHLNRNDILANLLWAQHDVLHGGGDLHEKLEVHGLPELEDAEEMEE